MIDAKEIRIGNLLVFRNKIKPVTDIRVEHIPQYSAIINLTDKEHIREIHLTPQLLVDACGFEKTRDGDFIKAFQELTHHLKLILDTKYEWAYPIICEAPEFASQDINMISLNRINSLHHLQNIWWSLSQTELQVNIDKIV